MNYVITIGREFGSKGKEIGEHLAKLLGIPIYYKELVGMAAELLDEDESELLEIDETFSVKMADFWKAKDMTSRSRQDRLFEAEAEVIRRLARRESCVIIGHCASYTLRHEPNVLNVFIYAPDGIRYQHLLEEYRMAPETTVRMMEEADKNRHYYYKHYTQQKRGSRELRQIMLDSSVFGVEGTARLLQYMVQEKFGVSTSQQKDS